MSAARTHDSVVAPSDSVALAAARGSASVPGPVLEVDDWTGRRERHRHAAAAATAAHRARSERRTPHPVDDFLFTYYSARPAQLHRWYPGWGTALADAESFTEPFHRVVELAGRSVTALDADAFGTARGRRVSLIRRLLRITAGAAPHYGCFGLHEWAMVYRSDERRHQQIPLRLGRDGTDAVVDAAVLRCSHHDAVRFYTPEARPRNVLSPSAPLETRSEQPGCLHATMDLYKWAYQLVPLFPAEWVLEAFLLAMRVRQVDMRASPYDLSAFDLQPIPVETAAGKAQYVSEQRVFAETGQELRGRMLTMLDAAFPEAAAVNEPGR